MELRIKHVTGYRYDAPVSASHHEARLTPITDARQTVRNPHVDVDPAPWSTAYTDYWGTRVTAFEITSPHPTLTVTATSTVRTQAAPEPTDTLTWEDLADPRLVDELVEFLTVGDLTRPPADLTGLAASLVASGARPGAVAREVSAAGSVEHAIGALREAGLPCRYVRGYVLGRDTPQAWLEWWDGAWQGFDPVTGAAPGDGHVAVAMGRDSADVRPLRGICTGAETATLFDEVQVTKVV